MNYGYYNENQLMSYITGMGVGMIILWIGLVVFGIICMWKIFEKAGEPGWKCLIPFYNAYVYMKIAWEGKYFWFMILIPLIPVIFLAIAASSQSSGMAGFAGFLYIAAAVAVAVIGIIAMVKLSKRFGKSGAFALGLIFLSVIFTAILAFDSSTYNRDLA